MRVVALAIALLWTPVLAQETVRISGRFVDAAGQPGSATVHLMPSPPSHLRRLHDLGVARMEDEGTSFELDKDGRFEANVIPGVYRLDAVTASGLRVRAELGAIVEDLVLSEIPLPRARELTVKVVDHEGKPIEEALVLVDTEQWVRPQGDSVRVEPAVGLSRWHGRTDETGHVAAPSLRGASHPVRVAAPGFLPRSVPSNGRGVVTVELERGALQEIQVTGKGGHPVDQAVVRFGESLVPVALTDEQGRAAVAAAKDRRLDYQVEAADLGYGNVTVPPGGREQDLTLGLKPPAVLYGKVVDRSTGDPLPGALIWSRMRVSDVAITGPDGRYELPTWMSSQGLGLTAAARGYSEAYLSVQSADSDARTVALDPRRTIALRVMDTRGANVGGAVATLWPRDQRRLRGRPRSRETNQTGRVELRSVSDGAHLLRIEHLDYVTAEISLTIGPEGETSVTTTLEDGLVGWGTIVDEQNRPLPNAEVWLEREESRSTPIYWSPEPEIVRRTNTDSSGLFELPPERPGRFRLHALATGFAPGTVAGIELEGDQQEIGTLRLDPELLLAGRVLDASGDPIQGAQLSAYPNRNSPGYRDDYRAATSAADGSFRFDRFGRGSYAVQVEAKGYLQIEPIDVELPLTEPLELRLDRGVMIRGIVRGADGEGIPAGLSLHEVESLHGRLSYSQIGWANGQSDGRFEIGPAGIGPHSLQVQAREHVPTVVELEVEAGGIAPLEISLERGAVITGSVTAAGEPISGAHVAARRSDVDRWSPGAQTASHTQTDGEGRYRLAAVPEGKVVLETSAEGYRKDSSALNVRGDDRFDVELVPGLRITGVVVDENGEPVEGVYLDAMTSQDRREWSGGSYNAFSAADGSFEITSLEPGWARLRVVKDGFGNPNLPELRLRGAGALDVEVVLERGFSLEGRVLGLDADLAQKVRIGVTPLASINIGGAYPETTPGYQGDFVLQNVSRGLWRLFAYLEGERHVTREIEVEGDLRGLDLDFSAGFTVHGIVTVDGEPARNAEVYGRNTDNSTGTGTRTDESGAFALSGLEEGPALIHVNTELPKLEKRQVVDLQGDLELSIDLTTAPFRVRVLDSEGVGLEGAAIFLVSTSDRKVALGESGPEGLLQARRLGELTAADYPWVEARHPVFGTKRIPHAEGETLQIEFTAQETLLATPISASGATPPTAIYWLQRDIDQIRLETRTTGTHELSVSPGSYLLWVSTGAEVGGPLRVEVPGETSVPLEPAGWARLKLGSVGFGGSVLARRGDVRYPERFYTSREGHQPLGPLPPGLWTLELHTYPTDEIVARIEVQILPGETVEIEVP